ncbi:class II Aldolase and Adducin domain-containing protein [Akanthomyces lecanii RCEF 1005]|uniref:Class II Aldolase and Adducin domain-containing protein n=1 Tax=Akanthomyces lecanii RCEF 1005 TaxID=1081108 RepID=A0A168G7G7_CORDF|nr:class II Aldolase and Adducin domain-containing protein [Akanthomyces lecanii RCEF 1005]
MASHGADEATLASLSRTFIHGSHILHHHGVVDAYGHLSFRHPSRPDIFLMSHNVAPASISSPEDLIAYRVKDAEPDQWTEGKGYAERMIHSEIYRRHPHIQAVVHSHTDSVVPYTISSVLLKPCYHMAAFIDPTGAPVYDIADHFRNDDLPDMLVSKEHLGAALAELFDGTNVLALMRGHGFTVVAESMELAVLRAVYTQKNASIQTTALQLARDILQTSTTSGIKYLSPRECEAANGRILWSHKRPWELWVREVEAQPLYTNLA